MIDTPTTSFDTEEASVDSLPVTVGAVSDQLRKHLLKIPEHLLGEFAPATHYLLEWNDYWLDLPGVDHLRVGQTYQIPAMGTWFRLRFENRIGLTAIQPYAEGHTVEDPIHVLVVSSKYPNPTTHLAFFQQLLKDLYMRAARLPFTIQAPTALNVAEAIRPPMPLFTLHFLCQHEEALLTAIRVIQASPHRRLANLRERVPLAEATDVGPDVIEDILHNPGTWQESKAELSISEGLRGWAPVRVLQERPIESFDTPENRFVFHFLRAVLAAADSLPTQPWWVQVPPDRRASVLQCRAVIRQALDQSPLLGLGPMHVLPLNSQVLLKREGYRELLTLWQRFQQARRPLFGQLQHAIDVRDIATLYEIWAYFALVDDIGSVLDTEPVLEIQIRTTAGLKWNGVANYGRGRRLCYNRSFRHPESYSVALRPDYSWIHQGRVDVIFDAKFALDRLVDSDDDHGATTTAKRRDLYKMHTYRDALGVRAAVALYPGTQRVFHTLSPEDAHPIALRQIISGSIQGVGALPYHPQQP